MNNGTGSTEINPQIKPNFPVTNVEEKRSEDWKNEMVDDIPIRGTRMLSHVYQSCNVSLFKPTSFEAKHDQN